MLDFTVWLFELVGLLARSVFYATDLLVRRDVSCMAPGRVFGRRIQNPADVVGRTFFSLLRVTGTSRWVMRMGKQVSLSNI